MTLWRELHGIAMPWHPTSSCNCCSAATHVCRGILRIGRAHSSVSVHNILSRPLHLVFVGNRTTSEHANALTATPSQASLESTATASSLSNHESTSAAVLQSSQRAGHNSTVSRSPGADSQQQWRCAPFVEGGVPGELQARQLGTQTSRQMLRQQQPVLIRGQHLASCRLSNLATSSVPPPSITGSTAAAADGTCSAATSSTSTYQLEQQQPQQQITVLCSPAETNRFMQADLSRNLPGRYYHIRKPETAELYMTFQEWCDSWKTWNSSRILLQVSSWRRCSRMDIVSLPTSVDHGPLPAACARW